MTDIRFVCGGYFVVVRPQTRNYFATTPAPEQILSVSEHIVSTFPSDWTLGWVKREDAERLDAAAKFGISARDLPTAIAWATDAFEKGNLGWPNVFYSLSLAQEAAARFVGAGYPYRILGIGLAEGDAHDFIRGAMPLPDVGRPGVYASVCRDEEIAGGGTTMGYDVLCWDGAGFCSYLCNRLEENFAEKLGAVPNPAGLFDDARTARSCAAYAALPETGAEAGQWFAWIVKAY